MNKIKAFEVGFGDNGYSKVGERTIVFSTSAGKARYSILKGSNEWAGCELEFPQILIKRIPEFDDALDDAPFMIKRVFHGDHDPLPSPPTLHVMYEEEDLKLPTSKERS